MATAPGLPTDYATNPPEGRTPESVRFVDRWIYVFTAGLLVVTVLVGFIPDSLMKVALVEAGKRPPFPPVLHLHAVMMGSWIMLLLAQTTLMATGRRGLHKQLGLVSMVLAPALILTGTVLIPTMRGQLGAAAQHAPPEAAGALAQAMTFANNILMYQARSAIMFAVLVVIALRARRRDAGLHKRLMMLTAIVPLAAATDRMEWLPSSLPNSTLTIELYPLLVAAPLFAWDLYRLRRVHRAYLIYAAMLFPFAVVTAALWNTAWWQDTATRLIPFS